MLPGAARCCRVLPGCEDVCPLSGAAGCCRVAGLPGCRVLPGGGAGTGLGCRGSCRAVLVAAGLLTTRLIIEGEKSVRLVTLN